MFYRRLFKKKISRSLWGDLILMLFLCLLACIMMLPFVFTISTSLKPANELWRFPPEFLVKSPTFKNFIDLFNLMADSKIPLSRYVFNTSFITVAGTAGLIIFASMCAYPISKYVFPFSRAFFSAVQTALMFSTTVTAIPSYIIMSKLHMLDTYWSLILPICGLPLGLFMMKQFMEQAVNISVLESADTDGAGEFTKFFKLVMPMVKPAWLTLMIFSVQNLWNLSNTPTIVSEQLKTLPFALSQIQAAGSARVTLNQIQATGFARAGVSGAITVLIMLIPLLIFIFSQSNVLETMSASGMKD